MFSWGEVFNTNTQIQIHKYKYTNTVLKLNREAGEHTVVDNTMYVHKTWKRWVNGYERQRQW